MFKKAVHQRLSGADRKKLKRTIKDKFPRASDSDIDILLPPKAEITVAKFQNRVLVYGMEGGFPMFSNVDGRGSDIFPTGVTAFVCTVIRVARGNAVHSASTSSFESLALSLQLHPHKPRSS